MELHNSLTKTLEQFQPLSPGEVRIYSCGPTVYERVHIGNLASFIYADTLRRALQASGYKTRHIMNITDVDDKTIAAAKAKYPDHESKDALKKLTSEYEEAFKNDVATAGVDLNSIAFVRATDNIPSMQVLTRELLAAGYAYPAEDGVYFSIHKYREAGKKYGQLVEVPQTSTSESRINNDNYDKEQAQDFALWKKQKPGEPAWDFEIGGQNMAGRPGWHIECSAMSALALGQPFDIHTGGVDLKFPHHENEIAQSTAIKDKLLAKLFFHNEHLLVDGQKMSKSLNNFYTLEDITAKGFDPLAFRLLVLQSHYTNQAHFSWANLEAASARLIRWQAFAALRHQVTAAESSEEPVAEVSAKLQAALNNNLDTPETLKIIDEVFTHVESHGLNKIQRQPLENLLKHIDELLGLRLMNELDIQDDQKNLIKERELARAHQDWRKSDELRDTLSRQGIGLNDTPDGPIWYRQKIS